MVVYSDAVVLTVSNFDISQVFVGQARSYQVKILTGLHIVDKLLYLTHKKQTRVKVTNLNLHLSIPQYIIYYSCKRLYCTCPGCLYDKCIAIVMHLQYKHLGLVKVTNLNMHLSIPQCRIYYSCKRLYCTCPKCLYYRCITVAISLYQEKPLTGLYSQLKLLASHKTRVKVNENDVCIYIMYQYIVSF